MQSEAPTRTRDERDSPQMQTEASTRTKETIAIRSMWTGTVCYPRLSEMRMSEAINTEARMKR